MGISAADGVTEGLVKGDVAGERLADLDASLGKAERAGMVLEEVHDLGGDAASPVGGWNRDPAYVQVIQLRVETGAADRLIAIPRDNRAAVLDVSRDIGDGLGQDAGRRDKRIPELRERLDREAQDQVRLRRVNQFDSYCRFRSIA